MLGSKQSFQFGEIDHNLYVTVLDSTAVRKDVPRCHRCKSFDHKVAFCPFPRSPRRRSSRQKQSPTSLPPSNMPSTAIDTHRSSLTPHNSPPHQHCNCDFPASTALTPSHELSTPAVGLPSILQTAAASAQSHQPLRPSVPAYSGSLQCPPSPSSQPTSLPTLAPADTRKQVTTPSTLRVHAETFQPSAQCPSSVVQPASSSTSSLTSSRTQAAQTPASATLPPPVPRMLPPSHVITTPIQRLNAEAFRCGLEHHEDQDFARYIYKACTEGVDIGYRGPRFYREYDNWPSANTFAEHIQSSIDKEVAAGIKIGPFSHPPFSNFVGSPLGAFHRKRSDKVRTIHDLSWKPGSSINDYISKEDYKMKYLSLDEVISNIVARGRHTELAKLDLEAAFHHIAVRPQDFELLGSTFHRYNPVTNTYCKEYYYDRVLQFGARSSPKLFNDFAEAAEYIMLSNGATYSQHYLDDYITMGSTGTSECSDNLQIMMNTCSDLGFSLNPSKICEPNTTMEYLGIILDTDRLQARISSDRLEDVMSELLQWRHRQTATKRQILSLIGKLTFVSRVVRPGRTFVRRMISLACSAPHLHHRVRLTNDFQLDVQWWLDYLPQWNGVSLFPPSHWESNIDLHLFTDSSDVAAGGYYRGAWFVVPFVHEFSELKDMSINWRELFAIIVAAQTFGTLWTGKRIMFHCDNMCVVDVVKSGSCRSDRIMDLLRKLFFICARFDFEISMCYVNTKANDIADALSRLQFTRFRQLAPHADQCMTMPVLM